MQASTSANLLPRPDRPIIHMMQVILGKKIISIERSRFYQGLIDMPLLLRGEDDFNNLNNVYLIIISPFDLFGAGKYCYTFENICREDRSIALGDGAVRMFLNTNGTNSSEVSPELISEN